MRQRINAHASARRIKSRRCSKRGRKRLFFGCVFLFLLCSATIIAISSCASRRADSATAAQSNEQTVFANEVYIDSTSISGMTPQAAKELLQGHADYLVRNTAITLSCEALPQSVVITADELHASTDLHAVLNGALKGGAGQSYHTTLSMQNDRSKLAPTPLPSESPVDHAG